MNKRILTITAVTVLWVKVVSGGEPNPCSPTKGVGKETFAARGIETDRTRTETWSSLPIQDPFPHSSGHGFRFICTDAHLRGFQGLQNICLLIRNSSNKEEKPFIHS